MSCKPCLVFFILIAGILKGYSQPCTTLGQNPSTAFPVCGTNTFMQANVPHCGGLNIPGACGTNAGLADVNPFWYKFTCFTAGTLGFIITPILNSDDYDWQVFDITGRNPNDVYTDGTLFVACNWSQFTGPTGATPAGFGLVHCAGTVPNTSGMPPLIAGHNYLLLVSNWSNSNQGYSLVFTGGTAIITDPVSPKIQSVTASCDGSQVVVRFNKKIKCSSLAADGSDFINAPAVSIASAVGYGCTTGFDMDSVLLTFNPPYPTSATGVIVLDIINGTDGNTLMDNCDQSIPAGSNIQFTIDPQPPLLMGIVSPPSCAPNSLTLTFADRIKCNSVAADGSDFTITGPSAVTITSATAVNCNVNGETNTVTIQLSAPILVGGNYQVNAAIGSDGNTLVAQCNRQVGAGTNTSFTITAQTAIAMGIVSPPPCTPSSITLTFAEPVLCNSIAANGSDFIITGPSAVTVSSATAVNCNANGETTTITVQLSAPILVTGNYIVQMATGSDGNTITGQCNRQVAAGNTTQFTLAPQTPVAMGNVSPPPCTPSLITLTFAEPVLCNSIAVNGSDFIITGPSAVTVSSATAVNCNANGETTTITIQLSAPILVTGNYIVQMATGSDGNTLTAQCNRQVTAGNTTQFTLAPQPAIAMGNVSPPACTPSSITLTFADPLRCNSIAANGSDFIITGPSAVTVSSATAVNCNANGETTTVTIQLSSPILGTGNYTVQIATGSDGNTLTGQCNRQVPAGVTTQFILAAQPPIPMGTIPPPNCSPSSITLNFTDNIVCSSIAANGSDFTITGQSAVTITSATATCNTNGETNTITLQLSTPIIVSGNYQVQMSTGSDGNTLVGQCNRRTTAGDIVSFIIPPAAPVPMDSLVPIVCSPSSLKLIFNGPIRCSSIAANGSDFIINGPSAITVASATGTCDANGLTTSINIQLASPVVIGGPYTLQLVNGTDGNTLLSDCNRQTAAGSSLPFTASDTVSAEFQYQVQYDCQADVISFSHDGQHNVNQWTWTVNGAAAGTAQTFTQSFSSSSQNQVQLVVSNGICSDTYSVPIVLNNKVTADFDLPSSVCPEDTVLFRDKSTGQIDDWDWTFGNGNTSALQNPPAQIYPLTGIEALYTISLTASNSSCTITTTKTLKVLSACIIAVPSAFTPNNDGLNDYFYPLNAIKAEHLDFKVFNRWGQLLFHSRDWTKQWDGRVNGVMQATGVYIWTLDFTHKDTKQKYSMKGTTTLIR